MICETTVVRYSAQDGPVVVEVHSGHATRGSYDLSIARDGEVWRVVGKGRVDDRVPDVYILPYSGAKLREHVLVAVGSYQPIHLPADPRVTVRYEFRQKGFRIATVPIDRAVTGAISTYHEISFQAE